MYLSGTKERSKEGVAIISAHFLKDGKEGRRSVTVEREENYRARTQGTIRLLLVLNPGGPPVKQARSTYARSREVKG